MIVVRIYALKLMMRKRETKNNERKISLLLLFNSELFTWDPYIDTGWCPKKYGRPGYCKGSG